MRGKEFIEYENPFDVGMTGLLGFSSGYHAMMNCDVLLMVGTELPYQQFFPRRRRSSRSTSAENNSAAGPKSTTDSWVNAEYPPSPPAKLEKPERPASKRLTRNYHKARKGLDDLAQGTASKPIHPQHVARVINELAAKDAIFACDVGTPTIWAARYLKMNGQRRLLGSFNQDRWPTPCRKPSARRSVIRPTSRHSVRRWRNRDAHGRSTLVRQLQPVKVIVFRNDSWLSSNWK